MFATYNSKVWASVVEGVVEGVVTCTCSLAGSGAGAGPRSARASRARSRARSSPRSTRAAYSAPHSSRAAAPACRATAPPALTSPHSHSYQRLQPDNSNEAVKRSTSFRLITLKYLSNDKTFWQSWILLKTSRNKVPKIYVDLMCAKMLLKVKDQTCLVFWIFSRIIAAAVSKFLNRSYSFTFTLFYLRFFFFILL